jgi:hypothetical protein
MAKYRHGFPMARASVLRNKCRVSNKRNPTALPEASVQAEPERHDSFL